MTTPIAASLLCLREASGMTLRELAEASGVSMSYLSKAERGIVTPTPAWIVVILEAVGTAIARRRTTAPETAPTAAPNDLFTQVAELVVSTQFGSVSFVQRRLGIRYAEAADLMNRLEAAGIVGPASGTKAREVLVSEWEASA